MAKIHDIAESLGQPLDDDGVVGHGRRWCHILQQFGLSPGELRALPHDRRVKAVVLIPLGSSTKRELLTRLDQPPDDFLALDRATLEDLRDALAQLPASLRAPDRTSARPTACRRIARALEAARGARLASRMLAHPLWPAARRRQGA